MVIKKKKKKEEEDYPGTSTIRTRTKTGRGVKEIHSVLGAEGKMIDLPEGVVPPKGFRLSEDSGTRKVSSTEYYAQSFESQDATRATRGLPPLTIAEKNAQIVSKLTGFQRAKQERTKPGQEFLEERGAFEETRPESVDLGLPEREGLAAAPVIGPGAVAVESVLVSAAKEGLFGEKFKKYIETKAGIDPLIQDPETLRELAIQSIQEDVIKEGTSAGEKFGALVESIPIVGPFVSKYANGLIETPGGNIKTITAEVSKVGNRATNMREKALTGKMGDPYIAYDQIVQMEQQMARMEQRIKLLSLQSATLQADADSLNLIEETILDAKQRIFDAKQSAATGIIGEASDGTLFSELQGFKE